MIDIVKLIPIKIASKFITGLLFLFRVFRLFKRALIHAKKFIPVFLIVSLVVVAVYFIGVELKWYINGFWSALKDLKSFLISIVITSYFITFLNKERQRKKDLINQYAIRYDIITTTIDFLIGLEFAFGINRHYLLLDIHENNERVFLKIIDDIKNTNMRNIKVNWKKRITYRDNYEISIFLNCITHELFNIIRDSCSERDGNLRDVKRQIYEEYQFLRIKFYPIYGFEWQKVEKDQIEELILYIIKTIKLIDEIICKPWAVNPRLTKALNYLYYRMGE